MSSPLKFPCALAALLVLTLGAAARAEIKAGDEFPSLATTSSPDGRLPATQGQVTLVDFWASWCAPCKASFPAYARIQADYASRGLVIVAVSVDDEAADYAAFVKKHSPPFATVRDQDHRLVSAVDVPAMPTSYLMGRNGKVRFVHVGFHGSETERALRAEIEALLAEKT